MKIGLPYVTQIRSGDDAPTVFGFIARPKTHLYVKPTVMQRAAHSGSPRVGSAVGVRPGGIGRLRSA